MQKHQKLNVNVDVEKLDADNDSNVNDLENTVIRQCLKFSKSNIDDDSNENLYFAVLVICMNNCLVIDSRIVPNVLNYFCT